MVLKENITNTVTLVLIFALATHQILLNYPNQENGDGRIFISKDKKTEIRMYGGLALEDFDKLMQEFLIQTSDTHLSYKIIKEGWFIFSGTDTKGNIVYQKTARKKINYVGKKM